MQINTDFIAAGVGCDGLEVKSNLQNSLILHGLIQLSKNITM